VFQLILNLVFIFDISSELSGCLGVDGVKPGFQQTTSFYKRYKKNMLWLSGYIYLITIYIYIYITIGLLHLLHNVAHGTSGIAWASEGVHLKKVLTGCTRLISTLLNNSEVTYGHSHLPDCVVRHQSSRVLKSNCWSKRCVCSSILY